MGAVREQRRFNRRPARSGVYALLRPYGHIQGQIIDLSLGGVSFFYYTFGWHVDEVSGIDLFPVTGGLVLRNLSCRTVDDVLVRDQTRYRPLMVRRRHVEFRRLDENRRQLLARFISRYTRPAGALMVLPTCLDKDFAVAAGNLLPV
ncbi:MAG: PilZ domain-containing protein [Deltaproteobacteria bacterium]|nr:PilZ domain-containing protein [Deltaproteobacteria bacterium]